MAYNRKVERYLDTYKKISKNSMREDYITIRKEIKSRYEKDEKYKSLDNIKLEKERVTNYKQNLNAPFVSIIIAIVAMLFSIILPILKDIFINLGLRDPFIIPIVYSIVIFGGLSRFIMQDEKKFICYSICENVLEELEKEILEEEKQIRLNNIHEEITATQEQNDLKDIKRFLGIK